MLINKTTIPINWISSPLRGNIAKLNVVPNAGINRLTNVKEHTGHPAPNKLITEVKIPVPDSLLYFLISLNLNITNAKFIPNNKAKINVANKLKNA